MQLAVAGGACDRGIEAQLEHLFEVRRVLFERDEELGDLHDAVLVADGGLSAARAVAVEDSRSLGSRRN